jgi:hypothetical protein
VGRLGSVRGWQEPPEDVAAVDGPVENPSHSTGDQTMDLGLCLLQDLTGLVPVEHKLPASER